MKNINKEEFKELTQGKVVIQFSATWCGPCKVLSKTIESNEDQLSLPFYRIDLDESADLAKSLKVMAVPTLILFDKGEEVKRTSGSKNINQLQDFIS